MPEEVINLHRKWVIKCRGGEVLSRSLCLKGFGPAGYLLNIWLPERHGLENEVTIRLQQLDGVMNEDLLWKARKSAVFHLTPQSKCIYIRLHVLQLIENYCGPLTDEDQPSIGTPIRFSEFVEVVDAAPYDRSSDKTWTRLTGEDKVKRYVLLSC
ncbi:unnamed protein product [Protopolystoma xenopodis]|uniref:Uncharacterized protein n=1 Tax=Protopolystoma xenopodis TaxID=117903 RepID=A0A3S4ZP63_9PLAT|nr:unnamed protein product [Protopolystoma xenopodis]